MTIGKTVDSISFLYLNDQDSLRIQHLTVLQKQWDQPDSEYYWNWQTDELIEKVGFKSALLPTNGGNGFTDDQYETDIRCYQDHEIGLIKLTEDENCVTTSTNEMASIDFEVSPNPTNGIIQSRGLENLNNIRLIITDLSGQHFGEFKSQNKIDLGHLTNGIYVLNLIRKESMSYQKISPLKVNKCLQVTPDMMTISARTSQRRHISIFRFIP